MKVRKREQNFRKNRQKFLSSIIYQYQDQWHQYADSTTIIKQHVKNTAHVKVATTLQTNSKEEVHSVNQFLSAKHFSLMDIHQEISAVYGNECMCKALVHNWVMKFKMGISWWQKVLDLHRGAGLGALAAKMLGQLVFSFCNWGAGSQVVQMRSKVRWLYWKTGVIFFQY